MPRNVAEVIIGPGTLYTASVGTVYPTAPNVAVGAGWTEIGYSEEGWTLGVDKTFENVFVAEELDPILTLKTEQVITLSGELAQPSLDNLLLAFGGGSITVAATTDTFLPPDPTDFDELALLFRTLTEPVGTATRFRDYQIPRSVATGSFEMSYAKAPQKVLIGIEFQALIPATGKIITVVDDTTP